MRKFYISGNSRYVNCNRIRQDALRCLVQVRLYFVAIFGISLSKSDKISANVLVSNANPMLGGACSWGTASLIPYPVDPSYFLQCTPASTG
jgi:hypothetical protein